MEQPLAYRMKPTTLDKFFGQEHIVGKDKLLYRLITADRLTSAIFWGPPGCGKTSLAKVIANTTKYSYIELNATSAGVSDIKKIAEDCDNVFLNPTGKTIVFIDEIHRFNKLQQDALLPLVEKGQIILIGATTENPYFEVNKALVSRSTVFKFEPLNQDAIVNILKMAIKDTENGLGNYNINITDEVIEYIASCANSDVRSALNTLELAVITTDMDIDGSVTITREVAAQSMMQKKQYYDKSSSEHYDTISAFIKSMRGSDPDATLLYLAKMLEAGEDPVFIARRIVILASEDVGLANPNALVVATSALTAVQTVGMPEGRIILAEAAVYMARSPKSNSVYLGIDNAIADVRSGLVGEIPMHIRNADVSQMEQFGYHVGYKYPHDYEGGYVEQQYLPDNLKDKKYFIPKGWEKI